MASTRNKNTKEDYKLEKLENNKFMDYKSYELSAHAEKTYIPGNGLLQGRVGLGEISKNGVDIESNLRGIRANDLENGAPRMIPKIYDQQSLSISDRMELLLPKPLVVEEGQRPAYMN